MDLDPIDARLVSSLEFSKASGMQVIASENEDQKLALVSPQSSAEGVGMELSEKDLRSRFTVVSIQEAFHSGRIEDYFPVESRELGRDNLKNYLSRQIKGDKFLYLRNEGMGSHIDSYIKTALEKVEETGLDVVFTFYGGREEGIAVVTADSLEEVIKFELQDQKHQREERRTQKRSDLLNGLKDIDFRSHGSILDWLNEYQEVNQYDRNCNADILRQFGEEGYSFLNLEEYRNSSLLFDFVNFEDFKKLSDSDLADFVVSFALLCASDSDYAGFAEPVIEEYKKRIKIL